MHICNVPTGGQRLPPLVVVSFLESWNGGWAQGFHAVSLETSGGGRGAVWKTAASVVVEHALGVGSRVSLVLTEQTSCVT